MSNSNTHSFQAEVSQVLHLVVHSLYSNKEIFLRELVSNASDALDKLRFRSLSEKELVDGDETLAIQLIPDEKAGTLTIRDNGVGMTERDLIDQLGTIARSGTREFAQHLEAAVEAQREGTQLIGQFGVGFYSAFLVADRVEVISRAAGQTEAFKWESEAKDSFTVSPAERDGRGTTIVLHLKDDQKEYAKPFRLKDVIRRHSDYVAHPIQLVTSSDDGESKIEVINQANALWQRSPKDVSDEQYVEFYKHLAHDWENPIAWKHFKIEGTQMFSGIVFLPETVRADLLDPRGEHGVRLHVRRVLAMESCDELLPKWLRFVRGVIDSEDLPLNVSRETLQDSKAVRIIKKQVVSQILTMIETLESERPADYVKFYQSFGAILKEGFHFEPEYSERLSKLVRYQSTRGAASTSDEKSEGGSDESSSWVSLSAYVVRMKPDQPGIYYVEGTSKDVLEASPHLEQLKKRGYEVLLMIDGVDPFALETLREFEGKPLINAMKESLDLGTDSDDAAEREQNEGLTTRLKEVLGERVGDVRTSKRLAESPACLVTPDGGLPPHMEAMFRAQNLSIPRTKRILEVNPEHPVIESLRRLLVLRPDAPEIGEWTELIYDQALIAEGSQVSDPALLAKRLTALLTAAARTAVEAP